jgi:hypothetical protein
VAPLGRSFVDRGQDLFDQVGLECRQELFTPAQANEDQVEAGIR